MRKKVIQNINEKVIKGLEEASKSPRPYTEDDESESREITRVDPRNKIAVIDKVDKTYREQCLKESTRNILAVVEGAFQEFCRPLTTKDALLVLKTVIEAQRELSKLLDFQSIVNIDDTSNVACSNFYDAVKKDVFTKLFANGILKDIYTTADLKGYEDIKFISGEELKKLAQHGYLLKGDEPVIDLENVPSHLINEVPNN